MKLKLKDILTNAEWTQRGYKMPKYDIAAVAKKTRENPTWLHFGAGNIFRAFPAVLAQKLLNLGRMDTGIIVCEAFDEEIIEKAYREYDNLSLAVTLKANGDLDKEVVGSVVESVMPCKEYERLVEIIKSKSLQMITFTITEKGYAIYDNDGAYLPWIAADIDSYDKRSVSTLGILTKLCFERYKNGASPIALVSLDNCSHNGTLLKEAVLAFANAWAKEGHMSADFLRYLKDESLVSFNWSMIDKITPRPSEEVIKILKEDGFEDTKLVKTSKNTYVAPFVNAEECEYLAIEDVFPNGRPPLEEVGVLFADKDTIDRIEKMKVCTCLNPLHTVLAVFGCLLGYLSISAEMKDAELKSFIEKVGFDEGMPVVVDPKIMNAEDFIKEVIEVRFPNPFVPDTPQRIATDTSKKIPVRFGETLKAYIAKGEKDLSFLTFIPLLFAGWLRYLMAIDDEGNAFEPSPDPNLEMAFEYVKEIRLGDTKNTAEKIRPLLENAEIFGVNLYEYHLGVKVERMFEELVAEKGAVRKTLKRYLIGDKENSI